MSKEVKTKKLVCFFLDFYTQHSFAHNPSTGTGVRKGEDSPSLYCDGNPVDTLPEDRQQLFNTIVDLAKEELPLPGEKEEDQPLDKVWGFQFFFSESPKYFLIAF